MIQEKRFFINTGPAPLASALAMRSSTAPLLVLAHGFAGNKNENGLLLQARDHFLRNGFSVLRFDFRACGGSEGKFKNVRLYDLVTDLQSVFMHIKSDRILRSSPIGYVGFSLGAGIGLMAGVPVDCYVFWSPAIYTRTDMVPRYEPELAEKGYVIKGSIKVGKEFIEDLNSDIIPSSLSGLTTPVLMVHGSADKRIPIASSRRALDVLRRGTAKSSRLEVIEGGDHSYRVDPRMREHVFSVSCRWFREHLAEQAHDDNGYEVGHENSLGEIQASF